MMTERTFEKITLGTIEKCYATLGVLYAGQPCLFFGGEGEGSLRAFYGEDFSQCDMIWEGGGGTMSIVPLPERDGWALASRGFYSMVESGESTVEIIRRTDGGFTHQPIASLPYLHRFDTLLAPDGTRYLFAASLHSGKKDKDDWSTPGRLYVGAMPREVDAPFTVALAPLPGDYYMNHGFCKGMWEGREAAFTASKEGVFVTLPPAAAGDGWRTEHLMHTPVSDIAVCDIDGDGAPEIAALLPFHGDECKVFHLEGDKYEEVYAYPVANDFYHAIISGKLGDEKVFLGGARKRTADLFLIRRDAQSGAYEYQQLEKGPGPSNLHLLHTKDGDLLLSANRMIFEAAVYRFR